MPSSSSSQPAVTGYISPEERDAAWKDGKGLASDATTQLKQRIENASSMVIPPKGVVPPEAQRRRQVGFDGAPSSPTNAKSQAAMLVSQQQLSKRSRVFIELKKIRADQLEFITYKLMNNGPLRQQLEHIFRVACSHGKDLEDGCMTRKNFRIFLDQLGVTTLTPFDQFEARALLVIREKVSRYEERVEEVQLLRFGAENIDMLFEYGLDKIGNIVTTVLGAGKDFDEKNFMTPQQAALYAPRHDDRLVFTEFVLCLMECIHRMIPPDFYPPIHKTDVHMLIFETFFFHRFGSHYLHSQIPSTFNEFAMVDTMAEVIGDCYDVLADMFLYCIAPTKFTEWSEVERFDRYLRIASGDAFIEYESLSEVIKKLRMPINLLSSEATYETFTRFDSGMRKDRVVIDFQGFTLICAHMAFSLYLTNAAYPTPQSKFMRMVDQYILPQFTRRVTIPKPMSIEKMAVFEGLKPDKAREGTELWIFGQDFPIRQTQNGNRCPLYVRFNDVISKGACMSTTVGNVIVPRVPTTEDTITQVTLADGVEPGTFVIKLEAKTLVVVTLSNDRLRWTKNQDITLSFEDVLATYVIQSELIQTLKGLFMAFGDKGPDYEVNGELMAGNTYLDIVHWSKMCQLFPLCVYDDGDPIYLVSRHAKFFENARPRSDALDITVPVITFPEMVNLIFRLFIAQHGPDEKLIDAVTEALKDAPKHIEQQLIEKKPKKKKKLLGAAALVEHQKALAQVAANVIHEGCCQNCGQDPRVRVGENPFLNLDMVRRPALKKKADTERPDVIFSKAIEKFVEPLAKDAHCEEITEEEFSKMTLEGACELADRGQFYFLNNLVQRMLDQHEEDYNLLEKRFLDTVDKIRTHGRYLAMQNLHLQQTLETINDALSRVTAIVVEHENLVVEERKLRLAGLVSQSETCYAQTTQLYQGLKATLNVTKDFTRPFVSDEDESGFNSKFMFDEASTFKQHLTQQTLQLEAAIRLRLNEIRKGPEISAEGLVRSKYLKEGDVMEDDDEATINARKQLSLSTADLIKRTSTRRDTGLSEEEVQKKLFAQQEILEAAFDEKLKEIEKKKESTLREATQLLEGMVGFSQQLLDIPVGLLNPCFKFLQDRGSSLKRHIRDDRSLPSISGGGGGPSMSGTFGSGVPMKAFVLTDEVGMQSDEDNFPSVLSMQQELTHRGFANALKFAPVGVMLRRAMIAGRDVLGKYSSNASIFAEFSKILKLELQNVLAPRQRDLVALPSSEAEMYTRDSVTLTQLTIADFNYVERYVNYQIQLEDMAVLVNVAKEEAAAAAAKANKRGAMGRKTEVKPKATVDVPISPNTAALAAHPEEMMALISPDSILPIEERFLKRLLERNAKLVHQIRAPLENRTKLTQTSSTGATRDVGAQVEIAPPATASKSPETRSEDDEEVSNKKKKKKKEDKRRTPQTDKKPPMSPASKPVAPIRATPAALKQRAPEVVQETPDVVADDTLQEALSEAEKFAEAETIMTMLNPEEEEEAAPVVVKKPKTKQRFDLPGPNLQRNPSIPQSQLGTGHTTEELMSRKWKKVTQEGEEDDEEVEEIEEVEEDAEDLAEFPLDGPSQISSSTASDAEGAPARNTVKRKIVVKKKKKAPVVKEPSSSSSDSDSSDESTSGSDASVDRPPNEIGYVEQEMIPDISLLSDQAKALREAQAKEVEASTQRLTAAIEKAMSSNPDAAAVQIELHGFSELVRQLREKVKDLETELENKSDQNKALREHVGDLKRMAIQGLEGKTVVLRDVHASAPPATEQQVIAARQVMAEKSSVRNRIARIMKKYGSAYPELFRRFDDTNATTTSTGLSELEELLEIVLEEAAANRSSAFVSGGTATPDSGSPTKKGSPRFSVSGGGTGEAATTPKKHASDLKEKRSTPISGIVSEEQLAVEKTLNRGSSIARDCIRMIQQYYPDVLGGQEGSRKSLLEENSTNSIAMLARSLLTEWQQTSVAALVKASGHLERTPTRSSPEQKRGSVSTPSSLNGTFPPHRERTSRGSVVSFDSANSGPPAPPDRRGGTSSPVSAAPAQIAPAPSVAVSFFGSMFNAGELISDADIRSASAVVEQLRASSPATKQRLSMMIEQHAQSIESEQCALQAAVAGCVATAPPAGRPTAEAASNPFSSEIPSNKNPIAAAASTATVPQRTSPSLHAMVSDLAPVNMSPVQQISSSSGPFTNSPQLSPSPSLETPPVHASGLSSLFPQSFTNVLGPTGKAGSSIGMGTAGKIGAKLMSLLPGHFSPNRQPNAEARRNSEGSVLQQAKYGPPRASREAAVQVSLGRVEGANPRSPTPPTTSQTAVQTDDDFAVNPPHGDDAGSLFDDGESAQSSPEEEEEEEFDYAAFAYPITNVLPEVPPEADEGTTAPTTQQQPLVPTPCPECLARSEKRFVDSDMQTDFLPVFSKNPQPPQRILVKGAPGGKQIEIAHAHTQCEGGGRVAFISSLSWKEQIECLFLELQSSALAPRTCETTTHQWLLGAYHCIRSNMLPNLELIARQYRELQSLASRARDNIEDVSYAVYSMLIKGIDALNEACGEPLTKLITSAEEEERKRRATLAAAHKIEFGEVNELITNLMGFVDHRIGTPKPTVVNSQRTLNRWRTHVILTLVNSIESDLQGGFPVHDRNAMAQLVEYEDLSVVQQRRLFFLQTTALALVIFSHQSKKSFVPLAMQAKVETPLPLSLQASSTGYIRMVRDCLLAKIIPEKYNDIGMKPFDSLSLMTKQFIAKVLSFTREEYSWLHSTPVESRTKTEILRLAELDDVAEKCRAANPVPEQLPLVTYLEVLRDTLILLSGGELRRLPPNFMELGKPRVRKQSNAPPVVVSRDPPKQADDVEIAKQPNSLDEPPSFLRDVQWAKPSAHRFPSGGQVHHVPLKSETPPPANSPVSFSKVAFTPGKISVSRSSSTPLMSYSPTAAPSGSLTPPPPSLPPAVIASHGGSVLGANTTQTFSAAHSQSLAAAIFQGGALNAFRPLTLQEQRDLRDLREVCGGGTAVSMAPMRSYKAWLDLELRQRIADIRSTDLDSTPSVSVIQGIVIKALQTVEPTVAANTANLISTLNHLSAAQTKLFLQVLKGEALRGSKIPAIAQ